MQLIKFQEDNVTALMNMLKESNRVLLADETGLGKTLTTVLLIAGLAAQQYKKNQSKFNVLYICSNERIARKNMGELCYELSEGTIIQDAAKLIRCPWNGGKLLLSREEACKMAGKRDARLSLKLAEYDSFIQIYNATPETSFRVSNSIKVGGTAEEYKKLMGKEKPEEIRNEDVKEFAKKRKEEVVKNFAEKKFDLIVLDEYQSYEDILPVDGGDTKKEGPEGTTISELLEQSPDTKVLLLSATPYQSQTKEANKFKDFKGILSFLSGGDSTDLVKHFITYIEALYDTKYAFSELVDAKNKFEKEFQKYCRRNQRSDAFSANGSDTVNKDLFNEPVIKTQTEFLDALYEEAKTRKEASDIRKDNLAGANTSQEELGAGVLKIQMERDTAWGYSFSKDYAYRKEGSNKELYKKLGDYENLLINVEKKSAPVEVPGSKRCDQSMLNEEEEAQTENSDDNALDCKRLFQPGQPAKLCDAKKWPNFKLQAIREIAAETDKKEADGFPSLYNCIWLPPAAPDYEPEEDSPYHKFYKKNPSKTIVFSHYKMTTRAIAALISVEASKGGAELSIGDEDWDSLCSAPEKTDELADDDITYGHPFCCAYNALTNVPEEVRSFYAKKIAEELISYFKRPEVQAVLARVGVKDVRGIMKYCRNGNLTAVLREYLSICRLDFSHNKLLLYVSSKCPDWKKLSSSEKLEKVYRLAWEEMKADKPEEILEKVLNEGFDKDDYIDHNQEPYDGRNGRNADGFEKARIAAWKTWFAYQMIYGNKREAIRERLIDVVKQAVESRKEDVTQKSFNHKSYVGYKEYGINAKTIESLIMTRFDYVNSLTFTGNGKVPNRYVNFWYANDTECEETDVDEFFGVGLKRRIDEKERDERKSNLTTGYVAASQKYPMKAWHTELFSVGSITYEIWDGVDDDQEGNVLDFMPKMHVCADFKIDGTDIQCGRIPLGFSSRYTNEIQDSNDHNDNGAEDIMKAFNSPFYPFVLAVTDTAKEGLNFHNYCRRIIHLNIPDRPAVLIQREGRVDRFRSLVLRQRLAADAAYPWDWETEWKNLAESVKSTNANGMMPNWYIDTENGPKIEKYYLVNEGTDDRLKVGDIERDAKLFKRMLGSFLEEELVKELRQRYPNEDITCLKLNLIPKGEYK